ncbi:MAG: type II secretion system F family protein [Fimbriiglobus sp.]
MNLFAIVAADDVLPVVVFIGMVAGVFWVMSMISKRNSDAEDRLDRIGRPKSLMELEMSQQGSQQRFGGVKEMFTRMGGMMKPKSDTEADSLRVKLANAGFRSENAPTIFQGTRALSLALSVPGALMMYGIFGLGSIGMLAIGFSLGMGLFFPNLVLGHLKKQRQQEIFLTLPDALDLLVVCVESGLGLDAGLRKVTDEMKGHAKVMTEELALANLQLQMGRPRREVLHDLGVRTGVDDMKSLAAILIQADRFGSSIAQALRVQSDSMRTRRRQIAEEKAAATAVKLIFPLVMFIFPAIFVVLVGPAAIQIQKGLLSK